MKGEGRGKEPRCSSVKWVSLSTLEQLTAESRCSSDSRGRGRRERRGKKEERGGREEGGNSG